MHQASMPTDVPASYSSSVIDDASEDLTFLEIVGRVVERDARQYGLKREDSEIMARIRQLTRRERHVMYLLYAGKSMNLIAFELGISKQTVAKHRTSLLKKMGVACDADLARVLTVYSLRFS